MRTDDFDYDLPDELIAQAPAEPRDSCRLLVLDRDGGSGAPGQARPNADGGSVEHRVFSDIVDYLEPGDLLVANRTRVMPARLVGRKHGTGGVAETLLLKRREDLDAAGHVWECLVNPGKRLRQPGIVIDYRAGGVHAPETAEVVLTGTIMDVVEDSKGGRLVRFDPCGTDPATGEPRTLDQAIHAAGHVPLPPYITQYEGDAEKYQTVYAMSEEHSAAAPTAGLHFTPELIERLKQGARIEYREGGAHAPLGWPVVLTAEVVDYLEDNRGGRLVRFEPAEGLTLDEAIHKAGHVPLPPYITQYEGDPEKYQTVYAMREEHSAAAPTAGLHFTPELIGSLRERGVGWQTVELEVGIDTFRLVEEDDPTQHVRHTERYHVPQEVVDAVHATKAAGHRVIAVGTTSVRSLESAFDPEAPVSEPPMVACRFGDAPDSARTLGRGDLVERRDAKTQLYLMPGSTYHVVDGLITNFHVPRSTLMMLVSAFATREQIMAAYQAAIDERYRFLSFGDAMLIR